MERTAAGLLLVVALTGCQRSATAERNPPPRYETVGQVRDALDKSGLGCADFHTVPGHHRDVGEEDALDTATCRVGNQDAGISVWSSLGEKQDWVRQRAAIACEFSADMGTAPGAYVDGGFWTVRVNSRMVADDISTAIGGQPRVTDCHAD